MNIYSFNQDEFKVINNQSLKDLRSKAEAIGNGVAFYLIYDKTLMNIASILLEQEREYKAFKDFVTVNDLNITLEKIKASNILKSFLTYRAAYFPTKNPILYRTPDDKYYFLPEAQKSLFFNKSMNELRALAEKNGNLSLLEALLIKEDFVEVVKQLGLEKEYKVYQCFVEMLSSITMKHHAYIIEEFHHFLMAKICIPETFEE